jgi:hypothetical protein
MRSPINHGALPVPPANRTPAAERFVTELLQIAPQGLNNYSGGMTRSKCVNRHTREAGLQIAQIAGNQLGNG